MTTTDRDPRRVALATGLLALAAALAPAPQAPAEPGPDKDPVAIAGAKATVCRRMVDYYRATLQAPPRGGDPLGPAERYAAGYEPIETWSRRLADAQLDATADPAGRVAILQGEVDRIAKFSGDVEQMARDAPEWKSVADRVEYYRLDAAYRLAREKAAK